MTSRERVARNFIKRYGMVSFNLLIGMLAQNTSGQVIGDKFGVSRERVRQWRNTFGQTITIYRVYPEIKAQLGKDTNL